VVMKKAQYFITCHELPVHTVNEITPEYVRKVLTEPKKKKMLHDQLQLSLNFEP
jgi:hypothetical protein